MSTEACAIVDQIRFEEQQTLWTREYGDSLAQDGDVFPGMMFSLANDQMEKSKL
jgi:adenosine deaminase CECR1